jgi:hypothetical protein
VRGKGGRDSIVSHDLVYTHADAARSAFDAKFDHTVLFVVSSVN